MTKSTITRERLEALANAEYCKSNPGAWLLGLKEVNELARMALAAMDSEPVAEVYQAPNVGICAALGPSIRMLCPLEPGTKLYRHAQPAPVVPEEMTPQQASRSYGGEVRGYRAGWNACRAAMLQELKKSAGTEAICRSDENVQVLHTKSPAQSDCCPAQNSVSQAQSSIDHGYRPECECPGCKATARICAELSANSSANPGCWCRTCRPVVLNDMRFVVCPDCGNKRCPRANDHRNACTGSNDPGQKGSAYPAAPQSPGSEPATMPGKWIPVSEQIPDENAEQQVLACFKGGDISALYYSDGRWDDAYGIVPIRQDVTHWMPLPAAPQEVKGE